MEGHAESRHRHDPDLQLERLADRCRSLSPSIYREQALYLQIVRDQLPRAVQTAIKHLLCDLDLDSQIRRGDGLKSFHLRVDSLVQRTSSLITIEQLLVTADRLRADAQRSRLLQVQALANAAEPPVPEEPCYEVHLGLSLPLDRPDLVDGLLPSPQSSDKVVEGDAEQPTKAVPPSGQESTELDLLRSLFVLAGESMEAREIQEATVDSMQSFEVSDVRELSTSDQLMPSLPSDLLAWMSGLDAALSRRLRNLSHALNVELMRSGIIRSLLPIQLLEAAINGQVPSQSAQSNLLRLQLPLAVMTDEQSFDSHCLLLRSSELEFDHYALRRCRERIQKQRRYLSTLVVKERHWQRRSSTREVQTHWWPNRSENNPNL